MSVNFHVIIPARYQSTRLPGKLLMDLQGQTVLERVYHQALQANPCSVTIATDSPIIMEQATAFGASVMMTSTQHQSGTDRIAEVVSKGSFLSDAIIVNVQGDEPLIAPELIQQVAVCLFQSTAPMATLCWPIEDIDAMENPNVVKVVRDKNNHALYFSRSAIPFHRDEPLSTEHVFRHVGLYAYRASFLQQIVQWPVSELESLEMLEQLRVLWNGYSIHVDVASVRPKQDINTSDDLEAARQLLSLGERL